MIESLSFYCKILNCKGKPHKQGLSLCISEGKKGMEMKLYKFLARKLFQSSKKRHIFAHFSTYILASHCNIIVFVLLFC